MGSPADAEPHLHLRNVCKADVQCHLLWSSRCFYSTLSGRIIPQHFGRRWVISIGFGSQNQGINLYCFNAVILSSWCSQLFVKFCEVFLPLPVWKKKYFPRTTQNHLPLTNSVTLGSHIPLWASAPSWVRLGIELVDLWGPFGFAIFYIL